MWSFLYQVPASAATLLKQFEQQTGQLSSPGTTCTLTACSPLYVHYVCLYSNSQILSQHREEHKLCKCPCDKSWWNQGTNCIIGVPQFTRDVPSLEL